MKRKRNAILVLLAMSVLLLAMTACSTDEPVETGAESPEAESSADSKSGADPALTPEDAQTAMEESCSVCHDINRVYLQPDATDWAAVIDAMVTGHGAYVSMHGSEITDDQMAAIVDFLKTRTMSDGEKVVRDKCATCHSLDNLTKQAKDADWSTIVNRMIEQHGATLTTEEQQSAINFLKDE